MIELEIEKLMTLSISKIENYAMIGLTSYLVTNRSDSKGCMRMFHAERHSIQMITPHNHRYDLDCRVLRGTVVNTLWLEAHNCVGSEPPLEGKPTYDRFGVSDIIYGGTPGEYQRRRNRESWFRPVAHVHTADRNPEYSMASHEFHSITFQKDACVLVFEGPTESSVSQIIEPYCPNKFIETMRVESWMFKS
jgi:hypothetical protein